MLTKRIIPCLDCRDGRVVKGIRFGNLRDVGSPAEQASLYEQQGADEIVLLDVSATLETRPNQAATVHAVRAVLSIPLTVGGGVRNVADAVRLLESGADKVSINSAAVCNPTLIDALASRFGSQCTVLAIDAAAIAFDDSRNSWEVVTHSGKTRTGIDVIQWSQEAVHRGAGEILLTSWDRDGTRLGYDLDLIAAVSGLVSVPVIASGGANEPQHLREALQAGADAVLAASIFHSGEYSVKTVKEFLAQHNVEVRPC